MKKTFLLLTALFSALSSGQKKEHISSFNLVNVNYRFTSGWFVLAEAQTRSIEDFSTVDYYEIKGGVGRRFGAHQPFIGIGRYGTYKKDRISQEELRLWAQYTYGHSVDRVKLDHRLRAEQRFFHHSQTGENTADQRYRYRLTATVPINSVKVEPGTIFGSMSNEVFFAPGAPAFRRNRVLGAVGYQFNKNVNATTGYLWQRDFSDAGNRNLHFLYLAVGITIDQGPSATAAQTVEKL